MVDLPCFLGLCFLAQTHMLTYFWGKQQPQGLTQLTNNSLCVLVSVSEFVGEGWKVFVGCDCLFPEKMPGLHSSTNVKI